MPNFKIVCNCIHELLSVFEDSAQCVHAISLNHLSECSNLLTDEKANENKQSKIKEFTCPAARLSASSHCVMVLTEVITDFIVRNIHPINTVDGEGSINLM